MGDEPKTLSMDGLFKELTWKGEAISRIFDLPLIQDSLQQEFQRPQQRRLDRLYRLQDGSLLNVEHQSSLKDAKALARRMADYHLLVAEKFPDYQFRQVVIFAPIDRAKTVKIPLRLELDLLDEHGNGLKFAAPVRDLRDVPPSIFERSGELDDLLLGLLGPGFETPGYFDKVRERVGKLTGEARRASIEKLAAIRAMNDNVPNQSDREVFEMWIEEVKDKPFVQRIVEIAGKERMIRERTEGAREGARHALAEVIVDHAREADLELGRTSDEMIELLADYADEDQLKSMIKDIERMTDVREFLLSHDIKLPGYTS